MHANTQPHEKICWTSALEWQTKTEVQWKEASDDVPQGQIGQIMGVQYNGDGDA